MRPTGAEREQHRATERKIPSCLRRWCPFAFFRLWPSLRAQIKSFRAVVEGTKRHMHAKTKARDIAHSAIGDSQQVNQITHSQSFMQYRREHSLAPGMP
jgi:hypothetical protein